MTVRREPPDRVFAAFGVGGVARENLRGGRGLTWRAGPVVVRPTGGGDEVDWRSGVLEQLEHTREFRTPRPIRAASGQWVVRALTFRITTLHLLGWWDSTQAQRHAPVVDAVV